MSGDKDMLILALKAGNEGKKKVIWALIEDNISKDNEIFNLKGRIEFLEKWVRWKKAEQDQFNRISRREVLGNPV